MHKPRDGVCLVCSTCYCLNSGEDLLSSSISSLNPQWTSLGPVSKPTSNLRLSSPPFVDYFRELHFYDPPGRIRLADHSHTKPLSGKPLSGVDPLEGLIQGALSLRLSCGRSSSRARWSCHALADGEIRRMRHLDARVWNTILLTSSLPVASSILLSTQGFASDQPFQICSPLHRD